MKKFIGVLRVVALLEAVDGDMAEEVLKSVAGAKIGMKVQFANPASRGVKKPPDQNVEIELHEVEVWGLKEDE